MRLRLWQQARAWLLVVIATAGLVGLSPAGAQAADILDLDCKVAPTPSMPSVAGPATLGAHAAQDATGGDPFADGSTTTVYREYGWVTSWWPTYDLGCGPDVARDPGSVIGTYTAELLAMTSLFGSTAFDTLIHSVLDWTGLGWVDAALVNIVADIRGDMWLETVTIVGLLTAIWFIINVARGDLGKVTAAAAWTSIGVTLLAIVVNYPAQVSTFADGAIKATLSTAYGGTGQVGDAGNSAEQIADGIVGQVFQVTVYDRWCEGMVGGSEDSASRWCPQLWKTLYLSRSEAALPADQRADLIEDKMDEFEDIADDIKEQDPAAYRTLQGKDYQSRLFAAGSANLIWPIVTIYPIWSLFVLLVSLMLLRVMVLLAPAVGPFLLHPAAREAGRGVLKLSGGALINAVVFCVSSAIYLQVVQSVLSSQDSNLLVRLTSLLILTIAFWVATKPWRRLTTMGRGLGTYVNKLADDKLAAGRIGRQTMRTGYMLLQLKTLGAAAGAAAKAGDAAQQVATTVTDQQAAPEPADATPYEMFDSEPAAPRSSQPPPPDEWSLPVGSAATTYATDEAGQRYEGEVFTPDSPSFKTEEGTYYNASSMPDPTDRESTYADETNDDDDGPVYRIYTNDHEEGGR